jgi:hypothetical protein
MANPIDFTDLVNRVADRFERQTGMRVSNGARDELIRPALPYRDHVEQELTAGNITIDFLESSIFTVLGNARDIANSWGRDHVGEDTTQESMRRYCPYLFWC